MTKLLPILALLTALAGQAQDAQCLVDLPFIGAIANKSDVEKLCRFYSDNRTFLLEQKNAAPDSSRHKIANKLNDIALSKESTETFMAFWQEAQLEHQQKTSSRDSLYIEGVDCLLKINEQELPKFQQYLLEVKARLEPVISESDKASIRQGISDYLHFTDQMKTRFYQEEMLLYHPLGDHIIAYNQLSFAIISKVITSEYGFGLKRNYKPFLLSLYDQYSILNAEFEFYKVREAAIVSQITHTSCLKRIGILRFYDGLNAEQKLQAMKVNMLMNVFKW